MPDPSINVELSATVWVVVYPLILSCNASDASDVSFYQYAPR
jgi:hypothetical protein